MRTKMVILAMLAAGTLCAQTPSKVWTLDECIGYALEHNIEIKRQELGVDDSETGLSESRWDYAPSLSAGSSYSISSGRVLDQTTYEFIENNVVGSSSASVSGSMQVFSGMRRHYALKKAKASLKASLADLESVRQDVELNVTAAYLQILCDQENLASAREMASMLESQIEKIQAMVDLGRVTEADLLQIRSQHYAALNDVATAEGQCRLSRMELCQLLEIQCWEDFAIEPMEVNEYDGMQLFPRTDSVSVESRPEYRSAEAGVEVARRNLQIARASYYPTLSLSAGYGTSYSGARQKAVQNPDGTYRYEAYPFFRQYLDNGSSYLSLSLNIPIFSGMSTRNSVRRAKNASLDAQYALQTVRKQLSREYEQALIEYQTSCRQYDTAREQLAYAEEAARMMTEKYNLGKTDFTSWNTAVTELAKATYAMHNIGYTLCLRKLHIQIITNHRMYN
ncbi:MAG: TolC family protein [Bacteroidales bacterium]|nr:TolC family protein [Bacteroidales bacterium]